MVIEVVDLGQVQGLLVGAPPDYKPQVVACLQLLGLECLLVLVAWHLHRPLASWAASYSDPLASSFLATSAFTYLVVNSTSSSYTVIASSSFTTFMLDPLVAFAFDHRRHLEACQHLGCLEAVHLRLRQHLDCKLELIMLLDRLHYPLGRSILFGRGMR